MEPLPVARPVAPAPLSVARATVPRAVEAFLAKQKASTRAAYAGELRRMATWAGLPTLDALAARLLGHGRGAANDLVMQWREHLEREGCAPATINRSLSALRSLATVAEALGLVEWTLKVPGVPEERVPEDLAGPDAAELARILAAADQLPGKRGIRDRAILHLLLRGLRRFQICELDIEHYLRGQSAILIRRKGREKRTTSDLVPQQLAALDAWVTARGCEPGPLFMGLEGPKAGKRLTGVSVWNVCQALAAAAGFDVSDPRVKKHFRPHAYRHAATTLAIEAGDLVSGQALAEHANPATTMRYFDQARKRAKKAAGDVYRAIEEGGT